VAETATPNRVEAEPTARPRDVAVLVEQVFENLRQRRITAARERTEQLRQLVAKSAKGTNSSIPFESTPRQAPAEGNSETTGSKIQLLEEPAMSRENPMSADDAEDLDKFFDDDEPLNK
jgi:hypothetical protein